MGLGDNGLGDNGVGDNGVGDRPLGDNDTESLKMLQHSRIKRRDYKLFVEIGSSSIQFYKSK